MSWLTPLGFLGLLGLIVLIIIYLIRPNYQNKIISSTFVWKLSLKYRKKKIPLSKLRNIILFICQVLIISVAATILAQPIIEADREEELSEKVVIIDASASMLTLSGTETRFERAVGEVRALADEVLDNDGKISVILAHDTASFIVRQAGADFKSEVRQALDDLVDPELGLACTYSTPDITGAIRLAEEITAASSDVEVLLYSDTTYIDDGKVTVKNDIIDPADWNAAILDVRAIVDENYYRFEIDVACYGDMDADVTVKCEISGVNLEKSTLDLTAVARCTDNETVTLVFSADPEVASEMVDVYSFESIYAHIDEYDSFEYDNTFYLYGGEKQPLKIQYYSALHNNYFASALMILRDQLQYRWNIDITEVKGEDVPALEGYDVYIFEHMIPATLPTDGLVILANPDEVPSNSGLRLGQIYSASQPMPLSEGDTHEIMRMINPENIEISQYTKITSYDGYTPLLYCGADPVFMVKNEPFQKIAVMSFSLNYSNLPVILEFPLLMYNLIEYYVPSTVTEYVFDINETVELNSRSDELSVVGPGTDLEFIEFPGVVHLTTPGVYTVTQTPISGEEIVENFYVKIPAEESNINSQEDVLLNPYFVEKEEIEDKDLLLYFAIALVALLFIEWWLQTREQF